MASLAWSTRSATCGSGTAVCTFTSRPAVRIHGFRFIPRPLSSRLVWVPLLTSSPAGPATTFNVSAAADPDRAVDAGASGRAAGGIATFPNRGRGRALSPTSFERGHVELRRTCAGLRPSTSKLWVQVPSFCVGGPYGRAPSGSGRSTKSPGTRAPSRRGRARVAASTPRTVGGVLSARWPTRALRGARRPTRDRSRRCGWWAPSSIAPHVRRHRCSRADCHARARPISSKAPAVCGSCYRPGDALPR